MKLVRLAAMTVTGACLLVCSPALADPSKVCVTSTGYTDCSGAPSTFNEPLTCPASTFTVAVNNDDPFMDDAVAGFDVAVYADPTVLRAKSIDFSKSILQAPYSFENACIDGVPVGDAGATCSTYDGPGVTHLTLTSATQPVATGTLFTVTYQVVGATGGMLIRFADGCTGFTTSVQAADGGPSSTCVTLAASSTPNTVIPVPAVFDTFTAGDGGLCAPKDAGTDGSSTLDAGADAEPDAAAKQDAGTADASQNDATTSCPLPPAPSPNSGGCSVGGDASGDVLAALSMLGLAAALATRSRRTKGVNR